MTNDEETKEREILVMDDSKWNEFIRKAVESCESVRENGETATPEEEEEAIREALEALEEEKRQERKK